MKTIEEVKQFITDFTHWEYQVAIGRNDAAVPEQDHVIAVVKLLKCYSKTYVFGEKMHGLLDRPIGKETNDHGDRIDELRQRKVFLIRKYEDSAFGDGITPDNGTLYSCFIGNDCKGEPDVYFNNYTVVEIDGKLKIVTWRMLVRNMSDDPALKFKIGWMYLPNSLELHNNMIVKEGRLTETLRIIEPVSLEWIADYNS